MLPVKPSDPPKLVLVLPRAIKHVTELCFVRDADARASACN